ncbi:MAG: DUF3300 domain-containing protein [Pseudomonadota bacterium]
MTNRTWSPAAWRLAALGAVAALPAQALIPAAQNNNLPCGGSVLVEAGDTLAGIAAYCGVTPDDILAVNSTLTDPDRLVAGQTLTIPAALPAANAETLTTADGELLDSDQLEALLAPVALHPDALLAEMLPAATYPLEIVQADRWLKAGNVADEAGDQPWAPSVQALTRYPEVLATMANDLDWTIAIGDAFLAQPDQVFDTVQTLRARADSAGTLKSNDYQTVVIEPVEVVETVEPVVYRETVIRIVPTHRTVYVPHYDPYWVYRYDHHHYGRPLFHFGAGYVVGAWLTHYLDWHHYHVRVYPRRYRHARYYYGHHRGLYRSARHWNYWHHRPVHRRGYRYHREPRVRVREGQRHLVHVAPRSRAGDRQARRDYRARERSGVRHSTRAGFRANDRAAERRGNRQAAATSGRTRVAGNERRRGVNNDGAGNRRFTASSARERERQRRGAAPARERTLTALRERRAAGTTTRNRANGTARQRTPTARTFTSRSAPATAERRRAVRETRPQPRRRSEARPETRRPPANARREAPRQQTRAPQRADAAPRRAPERSQSRSSERRSAAPQRSQNRSSRGGQRRDRGRSRQH